MHGYPSQGALLSFVETFDLMILLPLISLTCPLFVPAGSIVTRALQLIEIADSQAPDVLVHEPVRTAGEYAKELLAEQLKADKPLRPTANALLDENAAAFLPISRFMHIASAVVLSTFAEHTGAHRKSVTPCPF